MGIDMEIDDIQRMLIDVQILLRAAGIELSRRAPWTPLLRDVQKLEVGVLSLSTPLGLERSSRAGASTCAPEGAPTKRPPSGSPPTSRLCTSRTTCVHRAR